MTSLLIADGIEIDARLKPTSLRCGAGEMVAVIGPNGAGKTSLLRALAGIELDHGLVLIDGEEVAAAPPSRRIKLLSYLPATRSLVWPITARDVVALGLPSSDQARIDEVIEALELQSLDDRAVNSLSTGERTRVLLARSLAARPRLLLLDEPLANLDPYWVLRTLELMRKAAHAGATVIASLHDLSQLAAFDRAILVNDRRIVADTSPHELLDSHELSTAFRVERHDGSWRVSLPADPRSSQ